MWVERKDVLASGTFKRVSTMDVCTYVYVGLYVQMINISRRKRRIERGRKKRQSPSSWTDPPVVCAEPCDSLPLEPTRTPSTPCGKVVGSSLAMVQTRRSLNRLREGSHLGNSVGPESKFDVSEYLLVLIGGSVRPKSRFPFKKISASKGP